jgi:hypothetical protein
MDGGSKMIAKDGYISLAGVALVKEIRQSTDPCVASEPISVTVLTWMSGKRTLQ